MNDNRIVTPNAFVCPLSRCVVPSFGSRSGLSLAKGLVGGNEKEIKTNMNQPFPYLMCSFAFVSPECYMQEPDPR